MTTTTYGNKYAATSNLSTTEIAGLIRADIKAAQARGALPKAMKVSVTRDYFSGGSSIDVNIKSFPGTIHTPGYVAQSKLHFVHPCLAAPRYEANVKAALETLEQIVNAYNFDGSDSMSDYFHVRFYKHIGVSSELSRADYKAIEATLTPEQIADFQNV